MFLIMQRTSLTHLQRMVVLLFYGCVHYHSDTPMTLFYSSPTANTHTVHLLY